MNHTDFENEQKGTYEDDCVRAKQQHFIKLYQSYRIQHPTTTHEVAVEYVREVMADSSRIKFDWMM